MKKMISICLVLALAFSLAAPALAEAGDAAELRENLTGVKHTAVSRGRYVNWAGVSTVSQFTDAAGRFCFAVDEGEQVGVYRSADGEVSRCFTVANPYDSFGAATCDDAGNYYIVWGKENNTDNTDVQTIVVCKYFADGTLLGTAGGNGSEGMADYYNEGFYTKQPFEGGNCDVAVNGNALMVNYARQMYNGHQSNTGFTVDTETMQVKEGFTEYNSHSFDQRVTPYSGTGGFLLASQGDCFPRAFNVSVTDDAASLSEREVFHFWVDLNAYKDFDMYKLNRTYARLGNILETARGAALVAASARSLSEECKTEPYDVFVQVFDPVSGGFVTSGTRSGMAGNNGDTPTTDYGVAWLTDLAGSGKTVATVQAVSAWDGKIAVLYELNGDAGYDSTWGMILNADGSADSGSFSLGQARLNVDEDPVFADGAVQWVANGGTGELVLYSIGLGSAPDAPTPEHKATVVLSPQKLTVNGIAVDCMKYNIDNSNYFKLRDLAALLNGTGSQFDVGWDEASKVASITTRHAYTKPDGHELERGADMSKTAVVSSQVIMIDGVVRADLSVYNIGGSNYFKLRELGDALGFDVDYDKETDTAVVFSRSTM